MSSPLILAWDTCPQVVTNGKKRVSVCNQWRLEFQVGTKKTTCLECLGPWLTKLLASSGQHLSRGRQLGASPRLHVSSVHHGLCVLRGGGEAAAGDQVPLHLLLVTPAGGDTAAQQSQHQG